MSAAEKPPLMLYLAAPRGFCAGVDRAIKIVELALKVYGPPVYVRHEIVHNKYVVDGLRRQGAVFVDELDEIPQTDQPVIFSAHGVPKAVPEDAAARNMLYIDATCPLVSKVHKEAKIHRKRARDILLIGHKGHPEVIGTMGQLPQGAVTLIETVADAESIRPQEPDNLAWITQTTLSVDDTSDIVGILQRRFPSIVGPHKEDICYATTNRQEVVKVIAAKSDVVFVVGAPNSSNSQRLREVAERSGAAASHLVQRAADIDWRALEGVRSVGLTAGASAPEVLVDEVIDAFRSRFDVTVELEHTVDEDVVFTLPRALREKVAEMEAAV
uniref:4-hydroxy-3-methylbut-2-enyl diphosphate reductase n=1 Tax=Pararhizobium sp. IMCC3301 TaxID=3067904 RepID=UPI0027411475|nr:4-hydroxy-3-methylbut-2-enyl diphosphate reductase [Pararhizobium sp. IMCC3301]